MAETTTKSLRQEVIPKLDGAADHELVELLDGLYGELLSRVSGHYIDGVGDLGADEPGEAKPEHLGAGLALAGLVGQLVSAFIDGPLETNREDSRYIGAISDSDTWNVGLAALRHDLEMAAWESTGPQWERRDA